MRSHFQTPDWVCDMMTGMLYEYDVVNVLEPTPGDGNLVKSLKCSGFNVTAPKDFFSISGKYDAVVMNPPFTPMEKGYEILGMVMGMSSIVIALMPWLTIINSEKRTKSIMNHGLKSITHLPRNAFPGSRVQTCIMEIIKDYDGKTIFSCV